MTIRAPTHAFGDRQAIQSPAHQGRQQRSGRLARPQHAVHQARLLALPKMFQGRDLNAAAAGKSQSGLSRCSLGRKGGRQGRAQLFLHLVRLLGQDIGDLDRQAPWRGIGCHRPEVEPGRSQLLRHTGGKGIAQGAQGLGWQFLGAQFNQQILTPHGTGSGWGCQLVRTSCPKSDGASGKPRRARASK